MPNMPATSRKQPTRRHLPHGTRQAARDDLIASLQAHLQKFQTEPELEKFLLETITKYINTGTTPPNEDGTAPISKLSRRMREIGWPSILAGLYPIDILHHQQAYWKAQKLQYDDARLMAWTRRCIHQQQNLITECWALRCSDKHGHDEATRKQKHKEDLEARVTKCYKDIDNITTTDKTTIFRHSQDKLLSFHANTIQRWLHTAEALIPHSKEEKKQEILKSHKDIRTYFQKAET
jgi:hypothetical protein